MKPLRVFASNYGPWVTVDWAIEDGLTAIVGRHDSGEGVSSNGAGKTMLLQLIPLSLFGARSWSSLIRLGCTDAEIGLEFEHDGEVYRVTRSFSVRGRGKSTLNLMRFSFVPSGGDAPVDWEPLTQESQAATQQHLEGLLGVTEATFTHSVFAGQGDQHFADPDLSPRDRKRVLAEALGLDFWDRLRDVAGGRAARFDAQVAELSAERRHLASGVEDLDDAAAELPFAREAVAGLAESIDVCERQLDGARSRYDWFRDLETKHLEAKLAFDRASAELEAATSAARLADATAEQLDAALQELAGITSFDVDALRLEAERLADWERRRAAETEAFQARRREAAVAEERIPALLEQVASHRLMIEELEAKVAAGVNQPCDRCGRPLEAGDTVDAAVAGWRHTIAGHRLFIDQHDREIDRLRGLTLVGDEPVMDDRSIEHGAALRRVAEAEAAAAREQRLRADVDALRARLASFAGSGPRQNVQAALEALTAAEKALAGLPALENGERQRAAAAVVGLQGQLENDGKRLQEARVRLGLLEARMERREKLRSELADVEARLEVAQQEAGLFQALRSAYSPNGIPALIMENAAIPMIERDATRVLADLGVPFRVELRTQRELKTSDRLADTLDVVVVEPDGERDYRSFSGGERTRINLALRVALARLLAHRRGAGIEMLALDEPEFLDRAGVEQLARVLRDVSREIPRVVLITHVDELTDRFDRTVTVRRERGVARIEEQP